MSLWSCGDDVGSGLINQSPQQQQQQQTKNIVPRVALQHDQESSNRVYKSITCSSTSTFLVDNRGIAYAMGSGFLGVKSSSSQVTIPKALPLFTGESSETRCKAVFSNCHRDKNFTFFLAENGALYSLGNSSDFRTGVGSEIDLDSIRLMGGFDSGVEMVAIGVSHGIAITATSSIYVWGRPFGFGGEVFPSPTKVQLVGHNDLTSTTSTTTTTTADDNEANVNSSANQDPFIQMQAGEGYTLLLTKNGRLFGFGDYASTCLGPNKDNNSGYNDKENNKKQQQQQQKTIKIELIELDWGFGSIKQIACGYNHVLALNGEGRVLTWGSNKNGALGINQSQYDYMQITPTYINNLPKVIYMHASHYQSFVITINGDVYSWGYNVKGSLGTKVIRNYIEPERVYQLSPSETNGLKINQISICENYSLFLLVENDEGRIPTPQGTIDSSFFSQPRSSLKQPPPYPDLPDTFINTSHDADIVTTTNTSQLWCTGSIFATDNDPDDRMVVFRPIKSIQSKGKGKPVGVAVGNRCSYVSFQDGSIFDWGSGFALGHGVDDPCREPSRIYDLDHVKVVQIVASVEEDVCVVVTENGKVYGWGRATNYLNGTGSDNDVHHPRLLEGFRSSIIKVSMSQTHCLAVDDGGNIYAWGSGKALGNRNRSSMEKGPKKIQDQTFFAIDVAAGHNFSLMLSDSGHMLSWGEGLQGQLGLGENNKFSSLPTLIKDIGERFISIAAGPDYATAVSLESGSLYMWGSRESGLLSIIPVPKEKVAFNNKEHISSPVKVSTGDIFGNTRIRTCSPFARNCFVITEKGSLFAWGNPHTGIGTGLNIDTPIRVESTQGLVVSSVWGNDWQSLAIVNPPGPDGPVAQGIKYPIKEQVSIISPPSTPTILSINSEMLGKKDDPQQQQMIGPSVEDIQAHENFMKGLTDEVKFWTLVDSDRDIDTWCGRVQEVKEFLNRPEAYHYSPNISQSIQHSQKNIPTGERVIKGWVMYSINFKDYESDRILLVTTEAIHRIKYDWTNLSVIHDKKFPLSSVYKVKVGRFTDWKSSISSSLRSKVYDQQAGIQIWFENPATYKPPSFIQPFAKNTNVPYITLRPALNLTSTNIEEQLNICNEIGTAIQCAIHSQRNGNKPIDLLHKFSRESPAKNKDLAAFPVRKADIQRYHGNGLLSFAHNKFLKKTQHGFVDPSTLPPKK